MTVLRKLAEISGDQNHDKKLEILNKLLADPNAMPIALAAITQIMLLRDQTQEAEEKLLSLCKVTPLNPATLAICAWFYLSARMPVHAMRFLEKIRTIAPTSVLLNLDLASAQIASGDITKALNTTHEWALRNPGSETVEESLARLLVADGKQTLAENYGVKRANIQKCAESWVALEITDRNQTQILKRDQKVS
jgi:predicted Zn-dependent protease